MNTIDPHWHTELDQSQEVAVRVHENPKSPSMPLASPAARRPAAIVGIVMTLLIGFFFVHGVQTLRGQTNGDATPLTTIHITEEGFIPKNTTVKPGQDIQWINDDPGVPHILISDTLLTIEGPLYTDHILPGESFTVTLAPDAPLGTFVYVSLTEDFAGEVTVADASKTSSSTTVGKATTKPQIPVSRPSSAVSLSNGTPTVPIDTSSLTAQAIPQGLIPRNPYTVGSPLPSHSGKTTPPTSSQLLGSNIVKPFRQPETGPGLVIISLLSIGALWWTSREYMRIKN